MTDIKWLYVAEADDVKVYSKSKILAREFMKCLLDMKSDFCYKKEGGGKEFFLNPIAKELHARETEYYKLAEKLKTPIYIVSNERTVTYDRWDFEKVEDVWEITSAYPIIFYADNCIIRDSCDYLNLNLMKKLMEEKKCPIVCCGKQCTNISLIHTWELSVGGLIDWKPVIYSYRILSTDDYPFMSENIMYPYKWCIFVPDFPKPESIQGWFVKLETFKTIISEEDALVGLYRYYKF